LTIAFLLLSGSVLGPRPARADPIREIVVLENSKTTADTVRYIAGL
jgi:hypothetical protein